MLCRSAPIVFSLRGIRRPGVMVAGSTSADLPRSFLPSTVKSWPIWDYLATVESGRDICLGDDELSIVETIKRSVDDVARDHDVKDYRGFGLWFLEDIEEMSPEGASDVMTDGAWDEGRDAVSWDEDEKSLAIYQFKYSENPAVVKKAFTDLQRGMQAEVQRVIEAQEIRLIIVSLAPEDEELLKLLRSNEEVVRAWLQSIGSSAELALEHFDQSKFTQLFEKLVGVDVRLTFTQEPQPIDDGILGVIDARAFSSLVDKDELLAFNIRKFLGIRKNNINWKILNTLRVTSERRRFWMLNNGLVCIYTGVSEVDETTLEFKNLSIVNGAQTVNTVAKYLADNPQIAEIEPIWVVAKLVKVADADRDFALRLTVTSNTQNSVSYKDLRASEQSHEFLEHWLEVWGLKYQYKRGDTARGTEVVPMKDLAQAYVAWSGKPNVAFARAGTIFGENSDEYTQVFPERVILDLQNKGSAAERDAFLGPRLLSFRVLQRVREQIAQRIKQDASLKPWSSVGFHLVWMYSELLTEIGVTDFNSLLPKCNELVDAGFEYLFLGVQEFARDRNLSIPKSLKSRDFVDDISAQEWLQGSFFANKAREAISLVV